ncbi:MAG: DNA cytosine methyltransferase [Eubacteriales bacterium]|jgi:site-specific DNA-cytosine methylase
MPEFTVLHLFSGLGGAALGFQQAVEEYRGMVGRFRTLAGIDVDPEACADFRRLTGSPAIEMDLFSRNDYIAFHGHQPPADWQEAEPEDLLLAAGGEYPDVIFLSPPCKGFSGLLPAKKASSDKYLALNNLVTRGLKLTLEAFADNLPSVIMLENVPRITSRGEFLLKQVKKLLSSQGYVFNEGYHDCGEIGGLGQHRKRYLLIARREDRVTSFVYLPPKHRVKSIGEVIGPLPLPDDPGMGPMHRLPRLKWLTWVRLALIPAGGDWRDLEKIAPEQYWLEHVPRGGGSFGVQEWDQPGATVTGSASVKGSNAVSVADPRIGHTPREGVYRVQDWNEPSTTVTGAARVNTSNGAACIADPRLSQGIGKSFNGSPGLMGVLDWDNPSQSITGSASVSSSNCPAAIADPRLKERDTRHPGVYQVVKFDEPAPCVTGTRFGSGAPAIADPRTGFKGGTHQAIYRVGKWDEPAKTVTGAIRPNNGALSVADPRIKCNPRNGSYKVQKWDKPGNTIIGAGDIHAGAAAVADPRIPGLNERLDPPPIIISLDGTRHRPLTTLELAILQGFPLYMPDGKSLTLAGKSDARWRERIGNAVPPPAAKVMASQILLALMPSMKNEWVLGSTGVWVEPAGEFEQGLEVVGEA